MRRARVREIPVSRSSSSQSDPREDLLAHARRVIRAADPGAIEEMKWKKPSNPEGVPVWSHDGILCIANLLKGRLRLTFPKGASLSDPKGRFNARLDSNTVRAIDVPVGGTIDESALRGWIRGAVALNTSKSKTRR
jgi:hypothetical protein